MRLISIFSPNIAFPSSITSCTVLPELTLEAKNLSSSPIFDEARWFRSSSASA
ncbi:unannotated protein [freshwater metagenome]|uniref:Unannotated protein n=1 Tax=freshwater metagenome TaxID=449393 RepID=A0A6J7JKI0_9ZZZZ